MALDAKYERKHEDILKDTRPKWERQKDKLRDPSNAMFFFTIASVMIYIEPLATMVSDLVFIAMCFYFYWLMDQPDKVPFKMPKSSGKIDPNYKKPDGSPGMAEGILYLGNTAKGAEVWFNNNDARTHILYLGTTGSGKTFGLKSIICNALCWSSGYVYIDGKADTDLWSTLSALARRFGRDDDVLLMNYMTGNASGKVPSNTLNPFSSGSASYLVNMLTSLMPESGGDNAMWKERAVSLISAIMPILVWKRDNQNIPLSIGVIRVYLTFQAIIKISRDKNIPDHMRKVVKSYLDELPGFVDDIFDDEGNEKPGNENADTSTPRQQHGFLSMQFTRAMSSLGEDYGFIFDTQAADIDMNDVVLNRRLLITLIPALEKSGDETANLGKIISAALKGMMGATLGNTVEGDTATAIENKPTTSSTPFIAVFDEVGYYASQGMAVMAAQARSLGFCLIFSAQDMPALEKRVKEEARSITANCNIKLFGKLEDPTQTKEFFEKSVGQALVTEIAGYEKGAESKNVSIQTRSRASYEELKFFSDGQAVCTFGKALSEIKIYNHDIGHGKAMRVHHFLPIIPPSEEKLNNLQVCNNIVKRLRDPNWSPDKAAGQQIDRDIEALAQGFSMGLQEKTGFVRAGALSIANVASDHGLLVASEQTSDTVDDNPENRKTVPLPTEDIQATRQLNAADLFMTQPAAVTAQRELSAPPSDAPAAVKKERSEPISWADLIGLDNVADTSSVQNTPQPVVSAPVQAAAPVAEKQTNQPLSWAQLIGMESVSDTASIAPAPIEVNTPPVNNIVEPLVASPLSFESAITPTPVAVEEKKTNQPLTWAQLIGMESANEVSAPVEVAPIVAPVAEPLAVEAPAKIDVAVEPAAALSLEAPLSFENILGTPAVASAPVSVPVEMPEPAPLAMEHPQVIETAVQTASIPTVEPTPAPLALEPEVIKQPEGGITWAAAASGDLTASVAPAKVETVSIPSPITQAEPQPVAPPVAAEAVMSDISSPMSWQQLVGGTMPVDGSTPPAAPVAVVADNTATQSEENKDDKNKEGGDDDGSEGGAIQAISWSDVIGINSAR